MENKFEIFEDRSWRPSNRLLYLNARISVILIVPKTNESTRGEPDEQVSDVESLLTARGLPLDAKLLRLANSA